MSDESDLGDHQNHTTTSGEPPNDGRNVPPGNSLFENPFPDVGDPRHSVLLPYFEVMAEFRTLAQEYPDLSIDWKAEGAIWLVWPPPRRFNSGDAEGIPCSPGGDLHLQATAARAAETLLDFSDSSRAEAVSAWLNTARDRWLRLEASASRELWLYAIREFWLNAAEEVSAAGRDADEFEKLAEDQGYLPGRSTAIGGRVWSLMVTQRKCLRQVLKEQQLSTGQEFNHFEEPAGWIQDGRISHCFKSFAYFCGVLAARRARDLTDLATVVAVSPSETVTNSGLTFDLLHFQYRYPKGFDAGDQHAIEEVRLRANRTAAARLISSYDDLGPTRSEWLLELASGSAPVFGLVAARRNWSANQRRDTFSEYVNLAAIAGRLTQPALRRFFDSHEWKRLDDALFPPSSPDSKVPTRKKRGRRPDQGRREAIGKVLSKHGDRWRDHLAEIFKELDAKELLIGNLNGMRIDLGDGQSTAVSKWEDLDLAEGKDRRRVIDMLRKYTHPRTQFPVAD
jgi:hypothetical protein